jgi:predicted  nucleic acid-binding Zn-ribbon protein
MHPAIPHLIELQRVDHEIAALRAEIESFPKRLRNAEIKLGGAKLKLAAAKEQQAKNTVERKKLEFDAQLWKDRAKKYRDQSGAVKTNEAFHALQHEIATAEGEVAKSEDQQLEIMMAAEEAERAVRAAEGYLKDDERVVAAERKEIESLQGERKSALEAALAKRTELVVPVSEDVLVLYERIAKRHNGTALAQVRDDQCKGCGLRVLPHIVQELRVETNEEIFRCESCGLILYSLEPMFAARPVTITRL